MKKILIIGQAPAAVNQKYPYDTTMLYEWLAECGITIEAAQNMFDFEAVYDKFPGYDENKQHKKPSKEEIAQHWSVVEEKLQNTSKVLILGSVAAHVYDNMPHTWSCNMDELYLIHPSRRNYDKFQRNREEIIGKLKNFLK